MSKLSTFSDRIRAYDAQGMSVAELLAAGLSRRVEDVEGTMEDVMRLLRRYPNLHQLHHLSAVDLGDMGLDGFEAFQRLAMFQAGILVAKTRPGERKSLALPQTVAEEFSWLQKETRENFVVVFLNAQLEMTGYRVVSIGTLNSTLAMPREVFRDAIREAASCVLLVHNHPSGDSTPSREDIETTRSLGEAGKMLDIPVVDHVILGDPGHTSLKRLGYL